MSDDKDENVFDKHKSHRARLSGRKAEKKKKNEQLTDKQKNPKAFTFNSAVKAERGFRRLQDLETKKQHIPLVDRTPLEPPPVIVAVVGPPKVGKSVLIQCLVKNFVRQPLTTIKGPVTLVSGKKRRVTFIECNNDINSMIDIAKVVDLVLLLIDASFGFEMEIFEFLNICQAHGMPRFMGVLTHLDMIKNAKQLKHTKKKLKHRFWTEMYPGAKLFYLSGMQYDEYLKNEIRNLGRFISVMKFRPLTWRSTHTYILADRMEDLTPPDMIRQNPKCDRTVSLYGYVRGIPLNKTNMVHIPGCGDFPMDDVAYLPDPCPLPQELKKRMLIEKERLIYAPFSGVGGIVYDKDAVYIELGDSLSHNERREPPKDSLLTSLRGTQETLDAKMSRSELQLFSDAAPIKSTDVSWKNSLPEFEVVTQGNGRERRRAVFSENDNDPDSDASDDDEEEEEQDSGMEVDDDEFMDKELSSDDLDETISEKEETFIKEEVITKGDKERRKKMREPSVASAKQNLRDVMGDDVSSDDADDDLELGDNDDDVIQNVEQEQTNIVRYRELASKEDKHIHSKIKDVLKKFDKKKLKNVTLKSDWNLDRDVKLTRCEDVSGTDHEEMEYESEDGVLDDVEASAVKWKSRLAQKAADAFLDRQATTKNLQKLVYGAAQQTDDEINENGEEIGGLFRVVTKSQHEEQERKGIQDQVDSARFSALSIRDWRDPEVRELIKDCFVTGKWKQSEDAATLLKMDDDDDEEMFGDFEDCETGEKFTGKTENDNSTNDEEEKEEKSAKEVLAEKKQKMKAMFDAEYDNQEGGKSWYDELRNEVDLQSQLNKNVFEGLDDEVRIQLEGYRAGMYVRVEFSQIPCELVTNFDPSYPVILGVLQPGEENIGFVQVRIKKHRWHKKILKTRDPLIISLGWRRFQTLPIYCKIEDNLKHRMLKYTPEHVTCAAHFYGPITPQGTGFIAVQGSVEKEVGFRIAATGSVVEMNKSTQVMKKLKLVGTPQKIHKKTAFIVGMFNSALEVARFEGARIKTVSGIRGMIKRAVSKPDGAFRATFEDQIRKSDIVFCRTWFRVDVPMFYNPVTSLLLPACERENWKGMKTVGQIKREKGIRNEVSTDHLYTEIERKPVMFKNLVISKSLQRNLPYLSKPKKAAPNKKKELESKRVAVIREPHEEEVAHMMKMLRASFKMKEEELQEATKKRKEAHKLSLKHDEAATLRRQKELRKKVFRTLSKMGKSKSKRKSVN